MDDWVEKRKVKLPVPCPFEDCKEPVLNTARYFNITRKRQYENRESTLKDKIRVRSNEKSKIPHSISGDEKYCSSNKRSRKDYSYYSSEREDKSRGSSRHSRKDDRSYADRDEKYRSSRKRSKRDEEETKYSSRKSDEDEKSYSDARVEKHNRKKLEKYGKSYSIYREDKSRDRSSRPKECKDSKAGNNEKLDSDGELLKNGSQCRQQ